MQQRKYFKLFYYSEAQKEKIWARLCVKQTESVSLE